MRVLFITTNIGTNYPVIYPVGVGALSAFLKRHGMETRLFMAGRVKEFPRLAAVVDEFRPDLVGISSISLQSPYIGPLAGIVKARRREVPVIVGGKHASLAPEEVLGLDTVDAVLRGEGERSLLEYALSVGAGERGTAVPNIWCKDGGGTVRNPCREYIDDLDALPFVDREVTAHQRIIDGYRGTLLMLAGRGCRWECAHCSNVYMKALGKGTYMRLRSVGHVMEELDLISRRYRFKAIYFRDDTFTWDRSWTLEFTARYASRFRYPYDILTRADCLDGEVIKALAESGCRSVILGTESGNPHIRRDVLNRSISNEKILETCDLLHRHGVRPVNFNMVGLPYETPAMFRDTIELNKRIYRGHVDFPAGRTAPKIFVFNPFPGTRLHHIAVKEHWLKPIRQGHRAYLDSYVDMPSFPRKEVQRAYRRFRYEVYKDHHPLAAWVFRLYDSRIGGLLWDLTLGRVRGWQRRA